MLTTLTVVVDNGRSEGGSFFCERSGSSFPTVRIHLAQYQHHASKSTDLMRSARHTRKWISSHVHSHARGGTENTSAVTPFARSPFTASAESSAPNPWSNVRKKLAPAIEPHRVCKIHDLAPWSRDELLLAPAAGAHHATSAASTWRPSDRHKGQSMSFGSCDGLAVRLSSFTGRRDTVRSVASDLSGAQDELP
jgi:hypothetical protein